MAGKMRVFQAIYPEGWVGVSQGQIVLPTSTFALRLLVLWARFLTGALEDVAKSTGLGQAFLGLIVRTSSADAC